MNKPYVKQYNENGEVINEITKEAPYLSKVNNRALRRKFASNKYKVITMPRLNPLTNKTEDVFVGFGGRLNGNNRKNSCKRKGKNSREYERV
jgi:hypothetical protein